MAWAMEYSAAEVTDPLARYNGSVPSETGTAALEHSAELNRFLAGVERRAYRLARIATGDREEALDIVQDAMCKLVESYGARPPGEWGVLFQRILQSRIRDWRRRRNVRDRLRVWLGVSPGVEHVDPAQNLADPAAPSPPGVAASEQRIRRLEDSLRAMPLRQQQAFLLRCWEGYDVAQTARIMGCSGGSVKTHYARAVKFLRERLEDYL
jgi:RNA polymerase sigma-70 factor (ECF subfamily)